MISLPRKIVADVLRGNRRAIAQLTANFPGQVKKIQTGQEPNSGLSRCADSRVSHTLLTGQPPGSNFVLTHNAGVIIRQDDPALVANLSYFVNHLRGSGKVRIIKHVIHRKCGAITALYQHLTGHAKHEVEKEIFEHVSHAAPAWSFVQNARQQNPRIPEADELELLNEANAVLQMGTYEKLTLTGDSLKKALDNGSIKIVPFVQEIDTLRIIHGLPLLQKYGLLAKAISAFKVNKAHLYLPEGNK